jgi:cytochrome P450
LNQISRSPFVKSWVWLKPRGLNALIELLRPKNVRQFHEFVEKTVSERRQLEEISSQSDSHEENSRKDMFHYLYHAQDFDTGQPAYTADDVLAEASVLLIAGTETTVTSLCSFFFYITRNPRVYEKLLGEIRDTFGALGEICGRKLTSCKYLHACIDEALRLTPAIPSELPRTVLKGDFEIDGEIFPEGTLIGTAAWSLLHNEDYFEDPWVYRPERWIIEESTGVSEADVARAQAAFNPFSIGPGNCVGQRLATVEMLVCIARTLYQYDVRSVPGDDLGSGSPKSRWGMRAVRNFQVKDGYTAQRDGPMVEFRRRA